jgi:hypothetical protein
VAEYLLASQENSSMEFVFLSLRSIYEQIIKKDSAAREGEDLDHHHPVFCQLKPVTVIKKGCISCPISSLC